MKEPIIGPTMDKTSMINMTLTIAPLGTMPKITPKAVPTKTSIQSSCGIRLRSIPMGLSSFQAIKKPDSSSGSYRLLYLLRKVFHYSAKHYVLGLIPDGPLPFIDLYLKELIFDNLYRRESIDSATAMLHALHNSS